MIQFFKEVGSTLYHTRLSYRHLLEDVCAKVKGLTILMTKIKSSPALGIWSLSWTDPTCAVYV